MNINEVLDGLVSLQVNCVDRLYLNAYVSAKVKASRTILICLRAALSPTWDGTRTLPRL